VVRRFLQHYGMDRAGEVLDEFASAVMAFDPARASKAQISMLQTAFARLANRVEDAETEIRQELGATEMLQETYDRYVKAAWVINGKLGQTNDHERIGELEASFAKLIDQLEVLKPELLREQAKDREAEIWAGELRASFADLAIKLQMVESDMRVKEIVRHDPISARLTTALAAISAALASMNKETARQRTEGEGTAFGAMFPHRNGLEHDPHIAAALDLASLKQRADGPSLRGRLARLADGPDLQSASAA